MAPPSQSRGLRRQPYLPPEAETFSYQRDKPQLALVSGDGSGSNDLRAKHRIIGLTPQESVELMLQGNYDHAARLSELSLHGVPLQVRRNILADPESRLVDYVVVACSDARIPRLDSEKDNLVGIHIRTAGNYLSVTSREEFIKIKQAVSNLRPNGVLIFLGHHDCGAVKELVKWLRADESGGKLAKPPTGSLAMDHLMKEMSGLSPSNNELNQRKRAVKRLGLGGDQVVAALNYDWEKGGFEIIKAKSSERLTLIVDHWNELATIAKGELEKQKLTLSALLAKQRPHAIVVGTPDLPYSLGTIMQSEQNEIFSVTATSRGLDKTDLASIIYSLSHGVSHIALTTPGLRRDEKTIQKLFKKWKAELRQSLKEIPELLDKFDSGAISLSLFRYDLDSGKLMPMKSAPSSATASDPIQLGSA
ncbi:hypothetical protein HY988_06975 [Candidatus Micrarchaeota archaeon]|nr:hypothetical protein [Candidatus Micrarchaeota archaeon]